MVDRRRLIIFFCSVKLCDTDFNMQIIFNLRFKG